MFPRPEMNGAQLPAPLTPPDCNCTDLDGFMLNVERLMASELVALSTHEEIAAALFLWCRAWKQRPAASLPDDDRVMAAFARMPIARFKKVRDTVLRGFVKCSDGRFYHRTLAVEAVNAYERKISFQKKREADAERLRKWRASQNGNAMETTNETHVETSSETRFVAEGQGQGQGHLKEITSIEVTKKSRFDEFWAAYPSRGNAADPKKPAKDKFDRLVRDGDDPGAIILGGSNYAMERRAAGKDGTEFVMQATTFLSKRAWEGFQGAPRPQAPTLDLGETPF